jgi:hypothetical protein
MWARRDCVVLRSTYAEHMGAFRRWRGLSRTIAASERDLVCPICGNTGHDDGVDGVEPAFGVHGMLRGRPIRKCFQCGGGFLVKGQRSEPIDPELWSRMEAQFAEEMRAVEERIARLDD